MHLALCIVVLAVVTSFASRLLQQRDVVVPVHTTVLMHAFPDDAWQDAVWHTLERAASPQGVRVCVLVAGSSVGKFYDSRLRTRVRVEITSKSARKSHPVQALQRVARRFLLESDNGSTVVWLHPRARVVAGWDVLLRDALRRPTSAIVSAPTASRDGIARMPVLRVRSTGALARDASRPLALADGEIDLVPSVCWCAELVVVTPDVLRILGTRPTFVTQHSTVVPTVPLLEHDEALEESVLDCDEGLMDESRATISSERVGLTRNATARERILKFGSNARAARAVRGTETTPAASA